MGYFIKYLGRRTKGEKVKVGLNKTNITLSIINEKLDELLLVLENKKTQFIIPEDGLWILKCGEEKVLESDNKFQMDLNVVIS